MQAARRTTPGSTTPGNITGSMNVAAAPAARRGEPATICFERLPQCGSEQEVKEEADRCVKALGLQWWAFSMRLPLQRDGAPVEWAIDSLPDELRAVRQDVWHNMADKTSSLLQHGIPHTWIVDEAAGDPPPLDERLLQARRRAAALGVTGGICAPVAGSNGATGFLTLAASRPVAKADLLAQRPAALLFSRYLHLACLPFIDEMREALAPRLSEREVECLSWVAMGKTTWEIARLLALSEHTVVFHMRNAQAKLGAVNRQQAIARSMQIGILATNGSVTTVSRRAAGTVPAQRLGAAVTE